MLIFYNAISFPEVKGNPFLKMSMMTLPHPHLRVLGRRGFSVSVRGVKALMPHHHSTYCWEAGKDIMPWTFEGLFRARFVLCGLTCLQMKQGVSGRLLNVRRELIWMAKGRMMLMFTPLLKTSVNKWWEVGSGINLKLMTIFLLPVDGIYFLCWPPQCGWASNKQMVFSRNREEQNCDVQIWDIFEFMNLSNLFAIYLCIFSCIYWYIAVQYVQVHELTRHTFFT